MKLRNSIKTYPSSYLMVALLPSCCRYRTIARRCSRVIAHLYLWAKLNRTKVDNSRLPLIAEAEFAFVGEIRPNERRPRSIW